MSKLSSQRKKDIVYKLVKDKGVNAFSEVVLNKLDIFSSTDFISFDMFTTGISLYVACDFELMVKDYKNETGHHIPSITVPSVKKAFVKQSSDKTHLYKASVIKQILNHYKNDFVKYNKEYVSLLEFSRYLLAIKNVNFNESTEKKVLLKDTIKQRKRIEMIAKESSPYFKQGGRVRMIEADFTKKDICYYYNLEDLLNLENFYSN